MGITEGQWVSTHHLAIGPCHSARANPAVEPSARAITVRELLAARGELSGAPWGSAEQRVRPPPAPRGVRSGQPVPASRAPIRMPSRDPSRRCGRRRGTCSARGSSSPGGRYGRRRHGHLRVVRAPTHDQPHGPAGARAHWGPRPGGRETPLAERGQYELPFGDDPLRSFTAHTHTSPVTLFTDLAQVRGRGHSVTRSLGHEVARSPGRRPASRTSTRARSAT